MPEANLKAHLPGRRAAELRPSRWPVVTRALLTRAVELGEIDPATENPLVGALVRGYIHVHNAVLNTKRALGEAEKRRDEELAKALLAELACLQGVKARWPMEIVG